MRLGEKVSRGRRREGRFRDQVLLREVSEAKARNSGRNEALRTGWARMDICYGRRCLEGARDLSSRSTCKGLGEKIRGSGTRTDGGDGGLNVEAEETNIG